MQSRHKIETIVLLSIFALGCKAAEADVDKGATDAADRVEALVAGSHQVFVNLRSLLKAQGVDLDSDQVADWPLSGDGEVQFGDSDVTVDFTVDRTDFSVPNHVWSVGVDHMPLMAAGTPLEGPMTGTWEWRDDGDGGSVWLSLDGEQTWLGHDTTEAATVDARVADDGAILEGTATLGSDTFDAAEQ